MFSEKIKIQYVIPIFNEQECLPELFNRLKQVQESGRDKYLFEFIFVNDGSKDKTLMILKELAQNHRDVKVINLSRNFGHQIALSAGLDLADAEYVLIIDGDLQDPPELVFEMMETARRGADIVYGQRIERSGETYFKRVTAHIFYRLITRLCDVHIPKDTGDFRLISRKVLNSFKEFKERHRFIRGMIPWLGFKSVPCLYHRDARYSGKTKFSVRKMIRFALDAILSFSNLPIKIGIHLGFFMVLCTLPLIIYVLYLKLGRGSPAPGLTTLLVVIFFIGGIQIFMLGLVGEYIGKIFEEVKGRPLYVIDEIVNF